MSAYRQTTIIQIAAAVIVDGEGRVLLVRKKGTRFFMQPGGKIERDESAKACLQRELKEELCLSIDADGLTEIGVVKAPAANEPATIVMAALFSAELSGHPHPSAEIDEIRWYDTVKDRDDRTLAPLTRDHVVPLVARMVRRC